VDVDNERGGYRYDESEEDEGVDDDDEGAGEGKEEEKEAVAQVAALPYSSNPEFDVKKGPQYE
jgi:hypothetical protein